MTFLRSFAALALLAGPVSAQRALVATHDDTSVVLPARTHVPRWTNNRLVGCELCESTPSIYTIDRNGARETVVLDRPAEGITVLRDAAAGPDGSLVAVGLTINRDSRRTFIAWIAPDRSRQVMTRPWPYSPQVVAVAPDGAIWTVGSVMNDNYMTVYPNVLRHYSPSGEMLSSTTVPRTRQSDGGLYQVSETSALMASKDRIGWLTAACQYIEFSFDAAELGRYACPNGYSNSHRLGGVALSSANDLVVGVIQAAPLQVLQLDRTANSWKPVPVLQDSGNTTEISGFDNLTLVTRAGSVLRRYAWADQQ